MRNSHGTHCKLEAQLLQLDTCADSGLDQSCQRAPRPGRLESHGTSTSHEVSGSNQLYTFSVKCLPLRAAHHTNTVLCELCGWHATRVDTVHDHVLLHSYRHQLCIHKTVEQWYAARYKLSSTKCGRRQMLENKCHAHHCIPEACEDGVAGGIAPSHMHHCGEQRTCLLSRPQAWLWLAPWC
jgi:hypothetical protein